MCCYFGYLLLLFATHTEPLNSILITLICNNIFCFSKFIQDKYNLPVTTSGYIAGSVYYLSMVLVPFLGFIIVSLILFLSD